MFCELLSSMKRNNASRPLSATMHARIVSLTSTEQLVLEWVEQGKRNSEIALILGRSIRTIDCHVAAILKKLGVETRGAAGSALRAAQAGGPQASGRHRS